MADRPTILLTAFEQSGDALGARLITQLRQTHPEWDFRALGGPQMEAAGATLIERSTDHAVMLAGAASQAMVHRQRLKRLENWLRQHPIRAHVPIDSPAANWSICKLVRSHRPNAKIVHLAAPQLWAWAPWRIHKLRRLTDHVLCLLPFEPDWFGQRGVPATFVGHPLFDHGQRTGDTTGLIDHGTPRLALLPGSRHSEIRKNWPTMLQAFDRLRRSHPGIVGVVAATNDNTRAAVEAYRQRAFPGLGPAVLQVAVGRIDDVLHWSDAALAVSGTVTLQVAAHNRPMVALYNINRISWHLVGRWIVTTRTFTLPNILSEWQGSGRIIPELVPHFGAVGPVVRAVDRLLRDPAECDRQKASLRQICTPFHDTAFGPRAAETFLKVIEED